MTFFAQIEADLNWRELELAVFRVALKEREGSSRKTERRVFLRAAWAILYAHFEGFCKFALTVYFDEIRRRGHRCSDLPEAIQDRALRDKIKPLRQLPVREIVEKITSFEQDYLNNIPDFPEVETDSNLKSEKLLELLEGADITLGSLSTHRNKINTLVSRRNKIAHGERDLIDEVDYYLMFEDAAKTVMYELALKIDQRLTEFAPAPS